MWSGRDKEGKVPAGRLPQEQVEPWTALFSVAARSQVHWPAGRAPREQDGFDQHDGVGVKNIYTYIFFWGDEGSRLRGQEMVWTHGMSSGHQRQCSR